MRRTVVRAGHDTLAVTVERRGFHVSLVPQCRDLVPTRGVPDPHGLIPPDRQDARSIRTEADVVDGFLMSFQLGDLLAGGNVPHDHGLVFRGRGDTPTVGTKAGIGHQSGISIQNGGLSRAFDLPDRRRVILPKHDDGLAVRAERLSGKAKDEGLCIPGIAANSFE